MMKKELDIETEITDFKSRMTSLEYTMDADIQGQDTHSDLLQQLLNIRPTSQSLSVDDNKRGDSNIAPMAEHSSPSQFTNEVVETSEIIRNFEEKAASSNSELIGKLKHQG